MSSQHESGNADSQEATAVDAIGTVSDEGKRIRWKLIFATVTLIAAPTMIGAYILNPGRTPAMADAPVAVLLPAKSVQLAEADEPTNCVQALTNADRQKQGFEKAFWDNKVGGKKKRYIEYCFDLFNDKDAEIVEKEAIRVVTEIQRLYNEEGVRFFIVTMSGAAVPIKAKFTDWSKTIDRADSPVLIATVSSVPDIAELETGVLRHYIRSEDESELLSTYVEALRPAPKLVGVFYVEDAYGRKAATLLQERFTNNFKFESYGTNVIPTKDSVAGAVGQFIQDQQEVLEDNQDIPAHELAVAVIVGYGEMIESTLTSLRDETAEVEGNVEKFAGMILPVSTFTEEIWRPENLSGDFAERIHSIGPYEDEPFLGHKEGVVFQFSYMTLHRALQCTDNRGAELFWRCWIDEKGKRNDSINWANVEFTADGDSRVKLKMLDRDAWSE